MIIENDTKLDFSDVLIKPKRSEIESRKDLNLIRQFTPKYGLPFKGIPIIASNMATGNFEMARKLQSYEMFTAIAKHHNDEWPKITNTKDYIYNFYTIGMDDMQLKEACYQVKSRIPDENYGGISLQKHQKIMVDIANGYTQRFASFVKKVRDTFPDNFIVAGNVCTPEMVQQLILAGADAVKIGIGPGSQCLTREKTGVGYPQLSAAIECADAAHGLNAHIILDGGMNTPGDVCKAFCANADMVMLGGMFAGTDECEGELITKAYRSKEYEIIDKDISVEYKPKWIEKKFKIFYGMSSDYAQEQHFGGIKNYRASEGRVEEIEYKGPVENVIKEILGGLRSCGAYIGAHSIKDFGKCASFIKCSRQHSRF
jgi:GMP reductase